jgi:hypothetical protein
MRVINMFNMVRPKQREQLQSNHREKSATRRKVRAITDVANTALGTEEMVLGL